MNLEKIRNSVGRKSSRVLLAGLLLLSSRMALAGTESGSKTESSRKEISTSNANETKQDNQGTYVVSEAELSTAAAKETFELARIDFNVNYETDRAELPENSKEEIVAEFKYFLDHINHDNFVVVQDADWRVVSSCDERPTSAWGEAGNEALATARGQAVIDLLKEYLANYQFSGLDQIQAESLKNKDIRNDIVAIHADRKGETLITDIVNPMTGKNYSDEEVAAIKRDNPDKYFSLLAENRISQFRADIPVAKIEETIFPEALAPIPPVETKLDKIEHLDIKSLVKEFPNFQNVILLFDNSPSMVDDRMKLSKELERNRDNLSAVRMMVGHYSDKLQVFGELDNNDLGKGLLKDVGAGSDREASIKALLSVLEKVKPEIKSTDKTLILINTDEALQQLSAKDLESLRDLPENIEVRFAFYLQRGGGVEVPLNVIQDNFSELINSKTVVLKKRLASVEQRLEQLYRQQLEIKGQADAKDLKKIMKNLEKQQESLISRITSLHDYYASQNISMNKLSDSSGQIIKLELY